MSQDLAASIQSLVASPPPGTAAIEVEFAKVTYHLAGGVTRSETIVRAVACPDTPGHAALEDAVPSEPSIDEARMTALERIRAHVAEHGDEAKKVKDWACLLFGCGGPSGRELQRAIKARLLHHSVKAVGKDAGAQMISPSDLLAYLAKRERVLLSGDPPETWKQVTGGRLRTAA